jgi:hypothetical protein
VPNSLYLPSGVVRAWPSRTPVLAGSAVDREIKLVGFVSLMPVQTRPAVGAPKFRRSGGRARS